jgi:hypothetical protein
VPKRQQRELLRDQEKSMEQYWGAYGLKLLTLIFNSGDTGAKKSFLR